jgi:hypothetical protein
VGERRVAATASVWIVPLPQIAGALGLLVGLVLLILFMRRHRHRLIEWTVNERLAQKWTDHRSWR